MPLPPPDLASSSLARALGLELELGLGLELEPEPEPGPFAKSDPHGNPGNPFSLEYPTRSILPGDQECSPGPGTARSLSVLVWEQHEKQNQQHQQHQQQLGQAPLKHDADCTGLALPQEHWTSAQCGQRSRNLCRQVLLLSPQSRQRYPR